MPLLKSIPAAVNKEFSILESASVFKSRIGLGLIHINVRSLVSELHYIRTLIQQANPDILVFSETWLRKSVPDSDILLDGFNLFRTDRKGKGGGVTVYVKACFQVYVQLSVSVTKKYECLVLSVNLGKNSQITVIGAYIPPSALSGAIVNLADIFSSFISSELLFMGDFNLDWEKTISDHFKDICTNLRLTQLITKPKCRNVTSSSKSSLIDNFSHQYASEVFIRWSFSPGF